MSDSSPRFDIVHARILRFFPELVADLGGDAERLLTEVGLDHAADGASYRQLIALLARAAEVLARPDFGLRLARRQGGGMFGPLGEAMRNSRSFGEALAYVTSHAYGHSPAASIWLKPLGEDGLTFVGHDILIGAGDDRPQAIEQLLLVGHLAAIEMTGGRARARRVHFRHAPMSPPKTYRRYFRCDVLFDRAADGVFFSDDDLASPIIDRDARAYRAATCRVEGELSARPAPLDAQVRSLVERLLGTGRCTQEGVAESLGLHPRMLHRRLRSVGTCFRAIKDAVQRERLLHYLRTTELDLACISERLGFAEQSVLTRRCHHWFAATPSFVRSRLLAIA